MLFIQNTELFICQLRVRDATATCLYQYYTCSKEMTLTVTHLMFYELRFTNKHHTMVAANK